MGPKHHHIRHKKQVLSEVSTTRDNKGHGASGAGLKTKQKLAPLLSWDATGDTLLSNPLESSESEPKSERTQFVSKDASRVGSVSEDSSCIDGANYIKVVEQEPKDQPAKITELEVGPTTGCLMSEISDMDMLIEEHVLYWSMVFDMVFDVMGGISCFTVLGFFMVVYMFILCYVTIGFVLQKFNPLCEKRN